ncbi:hypothetical protein Pint_27862 [Pistacia integerrima]|uniref:Uncharacterized protein n=1 Tax=Pistacia integerrima TaxID=434235 RepID=A0ACC0YR81_9ROSI|nr:hypothetical protein Pint_27862 [Pistacia integerrima]
MEETNSTTATNKTKSVQSGPCKLPGPGSKADWFIRMPVSTSQTCRANLMFQWRQLCSCTPAAASFASKDAIVCSLQGVDVRNVRFETPKDVGLWDGIEFTWIEFVTIFSYLVCFPSFESWNSFQFGAKHTSLVLSEMLHLLFSCTFFFF